MRKFLKQNLMKGIITLISIAFISIIISQNSVNAQNVTVSSVPTIAYKYNGEKMYQYKATGYSNLYCLKNGKRMTTGTKLEVAGSIYDLSQDEITLIFGTEADYRSALWVIDNIYISDNCTQEVKDAMMENLKLALVKGGVSTQDANNYCTDIAANNRYNLLYTIQQALIWSYTNNIPLSSITSTKTVIPNYYATIYTALKNVADANSNYTSPNKNGMNNYINNITLDSTNATINAENNTVGPFTVNNINQDVIDVNTYTVTVNGTTVNSANYQIIKDGNNITIKFVNGYNLNERAAYTINLSIDKKFISTNAIFLKNTINNRQPLVSINKDIVNKNITATVKKDAAPEFDLHLSKNIEQVYAPVESNGQTTYSALYKNTDSQIATRELQRVGNLKTGATTDTYLTNKYPVTVSVGDVIKYRLTIHNEGELDGYATQITDYIAPSLEVIDPKQSEFATINEQTDYGWETEENSEITIAKTSYLENSKIKAYNKDTDTLDQVVVYVYCRVKDTAQQDKLLKNVAEITADRAVNANNETVNEEDRDSTPKNITLDQIISKIDTWEGNAKNISVKDMTDNGKYGIEGLEDDDDYENVKIKKFDLALTKTIQEISCNGADNQYDRLQNIKLDNLKNGTKTTAQYTLSKQVLTVKTGATIKYRISVYNEGNINGYANEITDYLPQGLELAQNSTINNLYNWEVDNSYNVDGVTKVKTNYLSKNTNNSNIINAFNGETLDSKYVEIECTVTGTQIGKVLTNVAEITNYGYYTNGVYKEAKIEKVDIDSVQDSVLNNETTLGYTGNNVIEKYENKINNISWISEYYGMEPFEQFDKEVSNLQDDDDFEHVQIVGTEFDLALRKYISAVNGNSTTDGYKDIASYNLTDYKNATNDIGVTRIPFVDSDSQVNIYKTGTAAYFHGKEPINVNIGDTITYTLRVYNEGREDDYLGYATEITDYLPAGLEFVSIADGYTDYSANTQNINGTTKLVLTYNGNEMIKRLGTDGYLKLYSNYILSNTEEYDGYYQEVAVVCKVTAAGNGKILTNRAEITADKAFDINQNEVDVEDRDSTPASLAVEDLNLANYYEEYAYGVNDTNVAYYKGLEGKGTDIEQHQDDTDFENIKVAEVEGKYSIQLEKIDAKNANRKLAGVTFGINATINQNNTTFQMGPTNKQGLTETKTFDITNITTDIFTITEVNIGNNEYITLQSPITLYIAKTQVDQTFMASQIAFAPIGAENNYNFGETITTTGTLKNGNTVEIQAKLTSNGLIKITIPNEEEKKDFDLALRKFITGVNDTAITNRNPVFTITPDGKYVYNHTKNPETVATSDIVTYTLRIYNEGEAYGYATEVMDDIPEGLEFVPYISGDGSVNDIYKWVMYREVEQGETPSEVLTREYNGKTYVVTEDIKKADYIVTNYLSKENGEAMVTTQELDETTCLPYNPNLLKPFNKETMTEPDYRDVKVQFKVIEPTTSGRIITNYAQITDDSDKYGDEVTDIDSTPNEWIEGEDDQDIEKIKVKYFDLALKKWVSKAIVIENGKETVTETGHTGEEKPEPVVKVDLNKSKLQDVVVKFEYQIKVTNEGEIAGYVKEISDYIPQGLKFVAADNPEWKEVDGKVVTDQLEGTLLQHNESATVTITLTWINNANNMGVKTNIAEISKDYNESGTPDIDSTPNNQVPGEDDIDDAPVMLTIKTGETIVTTYIILGLAITTIITISVIAIKKYVL